WPPRVTLGRLLPHAGGLGFKPRREGFPSGAKKEWGLSPKAKVRVLHTAQLDVTERQRRYVVEATKPWEKVRSMIEADLRLSPGCYKLTYNLQPGVDVWVKKTDRDWHFAVKFSKVRDYLSYLDLEICPSGTTVDENAFDEDDSDEK
nr:cytochrome P450 [Tanacetum cinerariifolium]